MERSKRTQTGHRVGSWQWSAVQSQTRINKTTPQKDELEHVYIKRSDFLSDKKEIGLFAKRGIKKGEYIGEYIGKWLSEDEADQQITKEYQFWLGPNINMAKSMQRKLGVIDASKKYLSKSSYVRYANSINSDFEPENDTAYNAKFVGRSQVPASVQRDWDTECKLKIKEGKCKVIRNYKNAVDGEWTLCDQKCRYRIFLVAVKPIKKDQEIITWYGPRTTDMIADANEKLRLSKKIRMKKGTSGED